MADTISGVTTIEGAPGQARVSLVSEGEIVASLLSDAVTGEWAFADLAPGMYEVVIFVDGYAPRADGPWIVRSASLLHFEGADASTSFVDVSGKLWTPTGNAQLDTARFKFGASSALFDGSGDSISTPSHADFDLTQDFTFECFVYQAARPNTAYLFCADGAASVHQAHNIYITTSGLVGCSFAKDSAPTTGEGFTSAANAVPLSAWTHVAVEREGSDVRIFVGGVLALTHTLANALEPVRLGGKVVCGMYYTGSEGWLNGSIDEFRFTKGSAIYKTDFSPPDAPFPSY